MRDDEDMATVRQTFTRRFNTIVKSDHAREAALPLCYLAITWVVGGLIAVFDRNPSRPDWTAHWYRVLQLLNGQWLAEPDPSGSGMYGSIISTDSQRSFSTQLFGNDAPDFVAFSNTAINSPYTYWPSLLADGHYVRASLITLICCSIMIAMAIYFAGQWKHAMLAAALLPTTLLSMTFPTSDAVSNATAFLFIGLVLSGWQKGTITWPYILGLTLVAIALGQSKVTFNIFILLLVPLIIRKIWFLIPFLVSPISYLSWSRWLTNVPPSGAITVNEYHAGIHDYLTHPWKLLTTDFISFFSPLDMTGDANDLRRNIQLVTGSEGNTLLPLGVMAPMAVAFVLLILIDRQVDGRMQKVIIIVTLALFYTATVTALVLSFSGVNPGRGAVGLQSRYFICAFPLLAMVIPRIGIHFDSQKRVSILITACVVWVYFGLLLAHLLAWPIQ